MITTVIFDFDGVILDTETPDYETWQDVFQSHGADLDLSYWVSYIGWGTWNFDVCGHLEQLTGRTVDRDSLVPARRRRYLNAVNANPVLPGVMEWLHEARTLDLKLGVASSSSRSWVGGHLERLGILPVFGSVKTSDDVTNVKPDPELYLSVTRALGARPDETLAIEDSAHGVTAAKAAGLHCVAVPNPITRHLTLDHADWRIESLEELSLSDVIARSRA